jgi:hypothetical protein
MAFAAYESMSLSSLKAELKAWLLCNFDPELRLVEAAKAIPCWPHPSRADNEAKAAAAALVVAETSPSFTSVSKPAVEAHTDAANAEVLPFLNDFTDAAAVHLQATAHGFLVRRQMQVLHAKSEREEMEAVIRLQATSRIFLARRPVGAALPQSCLAARMAQVARELSCPTALAQSSRRLGRLRWHWYNLSRRRSKPGR